MSSRDNDVDHEIRLRVLEELAKDIRSLISALDQKLDSHLVLIIGLIFASIICPIVLHYLKMT